jgi:hypothetical protein
MRLGPFRLNRQRAARAIAAVVAAFMLTGQVLAAAGLCATKAPSRAGESTELGSYEGTAASSPCPDHLVDGTAHGPAAARHHHCPTDDPTQQSRTVDVPAAQAMAALPASLPDWSDTASRPEALFVTVHPAEPRPLYARLHRLRL